MKTKKSYRQKIRKAILRYFAVLKTGDQFYGSVLADYCLDRAGCPKKFKSTVTQYMNQMKNEGLLNYESVYKKDSLYRKLS
jgi:hypothetical protein